MDNSGTITTKGIGGDAVFAQSIGDGGGSGAATGGLLTLGGQGGERGADPETGNSGGDVEVINTGDLDTEGELARGIFAQSVGGGGGSGGFRAALAGIGGAGSGGTASDGGDVTVTTAGRITTEGASATAVQAQSVGGGGGDG
ncbi:MAG: hypothetical protein AAFP86_24750, partial [Planctomycetota bacterium]